MNPSEIVALMFAAFGVGAALQLVALIARKGTPK